VAVGSFGWCSPVSVLREIGQEVAIIRCARKSEKVRRERRGLASPTLPISCGDATDASDSGEEFRRPGGVSCRRTKGRWGRSAGASYSHGSGKKRPGN
jgi:hypothetical protein